LVVIYARLVFITVLAQVAHVNWLAPWREQGPAVSRFKIAALLGDFFLPLCLEAWGISLKGILMEQLDYHGRYDRGSRKNSVQQFMKLS
jgi:hypothetical protein